MQLFFNKGRQTLVAWVVIICLCFYACGTVFFVAQCSAADDTVCFNDRAAEISSITPLKTPALVVPSGLTGKGEIVGMADSGLDKGSTSDIHVDLQSEPTGMPRVVMLKNYSQREIPDDPAGHGTHMAATVVGSGKGSQGQYQGIAPGASLYFQALLDSNGKLVIPENISTLFAPAYAAGVKVHINGWGSEKNTYGNRTAQIDAFVHKNPDFLPIFGAGNSGPQKGTLSMEANSKNALVVGSSQVPRPAFSPEGVQADLAAPSSSQGPTADARAKPDLLAPGSAIISACSSLGSSNYEANPLYTRMGGTSMAAAVTGGSIALLRQYLHTKEAVKNPSAAFIKALLLNGARINGSTGQNKPGILDLSGTILALQEKMFLYDDNEVGLPENARQSYDLKVTDPGLPLRVTLVWTDPPATAGEKITLVNDLNVEIKTPEGQIIKGNHTLTDNNSADHINNVEQIYIPNPVAGEYTITVYAHNLDEQYPQQSYALVYGQNLKTGIIKTVTNDNLELFDGEKTAMAAREIIALSQNTKIPIKEVKVGSQLYLAPNKIYIFTDEWESTGVQALNTPQGELMVEMNPANREGGYYIDPDWLKEQSGQVEINQVKAAVEELLPGMTVQATINPLLQTLWDVKAGGQRVTGYLASIDHEKKQLFLVQDQESYKFNDLTAVNVHSDRNESTVAALPFGYIEKAELTGLLPGMKVNLLVDSAQRMINYIDVERQLLIARITSIDYEQEAITVDTGKQYKVFPGVSIYKDMQKADLKDLKTGDWLGAVFLQESNDLLEIEVLSDLSWGRVVYASDKYNALYLIDQNNEFQRFIMDPALDVYRLGSEIDRSSLQAGNWVRVITRPGTNQAVRIDVAEIAEENNYIYLAYDDVQKSLMCYNAAFKCQTSTLFVREGYVISPLDILRGENIKITSLTVPAPANNYIARVEVERNPYVQVPELNMQAYALNGALIIMGNTTGERISLYRKDGSRITIPIREDGGFSQVLPLLEGEKDLCVLALDTRQPAVKILDSVVIDYPMPSQNTDLTDIIFHPARQEIESLRRQNIIYGYEDGTFRPEKAITRLEFITMLVNAEKPPLSTLQGIGSFSDYATIPWWGLSIVNTARNLGWISGYPDKTFRPNQLLSRAELEVISKKFSGYSVINASAPATNITRAEAAQIIYKMLRLKENKRIDADNAD